MKFSLRTLMIVMLAAGPILAGVWWLASDPVRLAATTNVVVFLLVIGISIRSLLRRPNP
jgi:hypothetical protein